MFSSYGGGGGYGGMYGGPAQQYAQLENVSGGTLSMRSLEY